MAQQTFKTWDQYKEEAKKEPFQLPISAEETLIIEAPTGGQLIQWARAYRTQDLEAMIITLCGSQWQRVESLISEAGSSALENLTMDIMMHFDLTEDVKLIGPGGGVVTERDPRKIRALVKTGYKVAGEATSRT